MARGGVESDVIAAAACGDGWHGAGRRRARSSPSAVLGARRSARQMGVLCGGCSAARSRSASRRLCVGGDGVARGGVESDVIAAAACGDGWHGAGRRRARSSPSAFLGARRSARQMGVLLCGGCSAARSRSASRRLCVGGDGVARGGVESDVIAAAACGDGWHGAGRRRARSSPSAFLGARRSARQMGVLLCGGCSAARSRSASRRLCVGGDGVARGGVESDVIAAAACGDGWHGAGRRRARSSPSAFLGARRSARQMGVLLCGGCSAARSRSASRRLCVGGDGVARGGVESDVIAAAACGDGWHGAGRRRARSSPSAFLGARRSARQMGVLLCGGCSAARSRSASRRLCVGGDGVARGGVESDVIAAAACGDGWHSAGRRRARSSPSAFLGARRSARQMGVLLCGGCSAARSRSASRRLCVGGDGVARGGVESDVIAAAACGDGWHSAGRRRARSSPSAFLGARRSARQMGVLLCGGCSAARSRSASRRLCVGGDGVARGGVESDVIAAAACGDGWHSAGRRRARSSPSAFLGARRSARQMGVLLCGGCSAARSRSASRRLCVGGDGVARGGVESDVIAAAACGDGWHGAGRRRARSSPSAFLGARRSARQMGVLLCGGCSAARSRSASRRLCVGGDGVARGGVESDVIAAAACGDGWHGAGRRRARSSPSAVLGARRSARQMGVLLCGGCSAARSRSASRRLCVGGDGVARGGVESDVIAAAACGDGWHGAGRRRARSSPSAVLGARRSARQMGVLCGGCSAARSRSASRRLCVGGDGVARGGVESDVIAAAACGDGWPGAGRRRARSSPSAFLGARRSARQMGVLCGGCSAARSRSASRRLCVGGDGVARGGVESDVIAAAACGDGWPGAGRRRARSSPSAFLGARRSARQMGVLCGGCSAARSRSASRRLCVGGDGVARGGVESDVIAAAACGDGWPGAGRRRARSSPSAVLGARRSARQMGVLCGGCSAARSRSASRRLCVGGDGVARGGVESDVIAAAACGDGWPGAGRRRARSSPSAVLGARRSARQMGVLCGGCSAARSRSASRRLCVGGDGVARGGVESDVIAAAACGDGWHGAGRRRARSSPSAVLGARRSARQMGVLLCGGCSAARSRSASRRLCVGGDGVARGGVESDVIAAAACGDGWHGAGRRRARSSPSAFLGARRSARQMGVLCGGCSAARSRSASRRLCVGGDGVARGGVESDVIAAAACGDGWHGAGRRRARSSPSAFLGARRSARQMGVLSRRLLGCSFALGVASPLCWR